MTVGLLFLEHALHVQHAVAHTACHTDDMCVQQQFFDRNIIT